MDENEFTHTEMWMKSSTNIKDREKEEPINEIVIYYCRIGFSSRYPQKE